MNEGQDRDSPEGVDALTSLADPVRRALYDFVVTSHYPVSRDHASQAVNVSRQMAAYHLDRLAEDGLLDFEFRRLTGREGPGAGRPAKLYRRSEKVFDLSLPPRRYELAARILLEALGDAQLADTMLPEVARRAGRQIGADGLQDALAKTGYEPAMENGETRFRNCPFHVLREQNREATCGLNLALVEGIVDGSGEDLVAVLAPEDGYCCVRLTPP